MRTKKWNDYRAKQWGRHFIATEHRLPDVSDFGSEDSKNRPSLLYILQNYKSISNFINECRGNRGGNKIYSIQDLKEGFEKFFSEHDYFPSATEIDLCPYLPSARTIQRSWGGLSNLRKLLQYEETDYRQGERRSTTAIEVNKLAFETENNLEKYLVDTFGEVFVHSQKRIGHNHVDFFIYTPDKKIAIDVFTFRDLFSYKKNVNNKMHTYKKLPYEIIFVPVGETLTQTQIETLLSRKKIKLSDHMKVMLIDELKLYLDQFPKYALPIPLFTRSKIVMK